MVGAEEGALEGAVDLNSTDRVCIGARVKISVCWFGANDCDVVLVEEFYLI